MEQIGAKQLFDQYHQSLQSHYVAQEAQAIAFWLLEDFLQLSKTSILVNQAVQLSADKKNALAQALTRLKNQEPIQYVLGHTEFYGLHFQVRPGVLIPRPETEELVDWIVQNHSAQNLQVLDIGTGSGCVAISLAKNLSLPKVYGLDVSTDALGIAQQNAVANQVKVSFIQDNILQPQHIQAQFPADQSLDIVVSNPPYVTPAEKAQMSANVLEHEPDLALFVPETQPLVFYEAIARLASRKLKPGGMLYFEINEQYGQEMQALLQSLGFVHLQLRQDMFGKDRMMRGELPVQYMK